MCDEPRLGHGGLTEADSRPGSLVALPDFFIAGAPKAGTSALHRADWLADHGRGAFPARAANPTP
jgi:hypothetical protein